MAIKLKYLPLSTKPEVGMLYRAPMNGGLVVVTQVSPTSEGWSAVRAKSYGFHIYGSIHMSKKPVVTEYVYDGVDLRPVPSKRTYGRMARIPVRTYV